jgi:hypothetical protein
VPGGETAWNSLSGTQQSNYAAITQALAGTNLKDGSSALSQVASVSAIDNMDIAVKWKDGAQKKLEDAGFASRPGIGHTGESGMIGLPTSKGIKGSFVQVQGIHVLFNDADKGKTGHVHVDYRSGFAHFFNDNSDVRKNYDTYKQWFGPIPGYRP